MKILLAVIAGFILPTVLAMAAVAAPSDLTSAPGVISVEGVFE